MKTCAIGSLALAVLSQALNAVAHLNLPPANAGCFPNFVAADALPPGQAYEAHIHATRSVPIVSCR